MHKKSCYNVIASHLTWLPKVKCKDSNQRHLTDNSFHPFAFKMCAKRIVVYKNDAACQKILFCLN